MARYSLDIPGVARWENEARQKSLAVQRESIRQLAYRIIDDAPVDTGFMVASAKVTLGGPTGSLAERERPKGYWEPEARALKMAEVKAVTTAMYFKDTFVMRFVAEYTKWVHEGTVRQTAQPFIDINVAAWSAICRKAVAMVKARYG